MKSGTDKGPDPRPGSTHPKRFCPTSRLSCKKGKSQVSLGTESEYNPLGESGGEVTFLEKQQQ